MAQFAEAQRCCIEATEIWREALGKGHPTYAISLSNLATLYSDAGEFDKAESLYLKALEIEKQAHGEEHPGYAGSLNNLATLYQEAGQYGEAESMLRKGDGNSEENPRRETS